MDREVGSGSMSQVKRPCGICGNDLTTLERDTGLFNHTACDTVPQDIELTSPPAEEEEEPLAVPVGLAGVNLFTPVDPKAPGCPLPKLAQAIKDEFTTILCW